MTEKSWAQENLPLPTTLEEAIRQRDAWVASAMQFHKNETYYRGLVVSIGEKLGPDAYVSDDGSVQQDILCAKIPEMIERLIH
jgi:hypothetical protein